MLLFIDESWQQSDDRKYKAGVLAAVAIASQQFNEISTEVRGLKCKHLGFQADGLELKGNKIFQRYYFRLEKKGVPSNQLNLARSIYSVCETNGLKVFATLTFPEQELDLACANPNQLERPFFFLFERINQFMKESHPDAVAKLVFDDRGVSTNERISRSVSNFFHKSSTGKSFDRIMKVPLFAISRENVGIQIADLIAHVIGRRFTGDQQLTLDFFKRVKVLQYQSQELVGKTPGGSPGKLWGLKVIKKGREDESLPIEESPK
ncbi:MAG: DUF3800 domain-containing protein [Elusimicrobia bacterium]|nr:DUF3800 domain-containing protein [Elusimicrobiota bacterium]